MPVSFEVAKIERVAIPIPEHRDLTRARKYVGLARRLQLVGYDGEIQEIATFSKRHFLSPRFTQQDRNYNKNLHKKMLFATRISQVLHREAPLAGDFASRNAIVAQKLQVRPLRFCAGPIENYVIARRVASAMSAEKQGNVQVRVDTDVLPIYGNRVMPLVLLPTNDFNIARTFKDYIEVAFEALGDAQGRKLSIDETFAAVDQSLADIGLAAEPSKLWTPPSYY